MLVDIDWVQMVQQRTALINATDLKDIKWVKDGKEVQFTNEQIEQFKFMGLNNTDILGIFDYSTVDTNNGQ